MFPGKWGNTKAQTVARFLLAVLLCTIPAAGQVTVGDYTKMNLAGWLGFGYNGGWQNLGPSTHSTSVIGDLTLNGYYYHPSFVSFNVHPYYNRNQANAVSQTTANTSGFESSANFFSGSHFPGAIGYSRQMNDAGEVGLPGSGLLSTDGSSQNFTITWSEFLPNLPTLTANFSAYSSASSIVGTDSKSSFSGHNFNLNSTYLLAGFQLQGFYNRQTIGLSLPDFVSPETTSSETASSTVGVSATHKLPLSGSFNASWNRSSYGANHDISDGNAYNNLNVGAAILPTRKLTLSTNVTFTDNISGVLQQSLIEDGVFAPVVIDTSSRSITVNNQAYYTLGYGFGLSGYVNYRDQTFRGEHISNTQYGGLVTYRYARPLFGLLYFNFGLVNTTNETGDNSLGFTGNVGITKKFGRWETNADFSYQQSVQTLLATYTTSNISYGGYVRRRLGYDFAWNANARAIHSALTQRDGDNNRSESFGTGLSWRRYTVNGFYSQSSGSSVLSTNGTLVPSPLAPVLIPDVLFFNARSYSVSLAATPIKRLTITGYYTKVRSQTESEVFSFNRGDRYNALVEYNFRKMAFRGGFTRTQQAISSSSVLPAVVNSYFFNISRWFNIF